MNYLRLNSIFLIFRKLVNKILILTLISIIIIAIVLLFITSSTNVTLTTEDDLSTSTNVTLTTEDDLSTYMREFVIHLHYPQIVEFGQCSVVARNIHKMLSQESFVQSDAFASELNFDQSTSTIIVPCEYVLNNTISQLALRYVVEDSPLHPGHYEYQITPFDIKDPRGFIYHTDEEIKNYKFVEDKSSVIVIEPIFTASAYQSGIYEAWEGRCDESCLNVPICFDCLLIPDAAFGQSITAVNVFKQLEYPIISDYDFGMNPEIIFEYDAVIMLHNEYVTREMFDAITSHPHTLYLYPNALYQEIKFNSTNVWMASTSLDREDTFFNWEYDNTHPYEFDRDCIDWVFRDIENGAQLLCYPELRITYDLDLLKYIHDFVH